MQDSDQVVNCIHPNKPVAAMRCYNTLILYCCCSELRSQPLSETDPSRVPGCLKRLSRVQSKEVSGLSQACSQVPSRVSSQKNRFDGDLGSRVVFGELRLPEDRSTSLKNVAQLSCFPTAGYQSSHPSSASVTSYHIH